jgi:YHS domain-containing protein
MTATPEKAAGMFEYRGTTYYFCSAGCLAKFRADPERYLAAAGGADDAAAPRGWRRDGAPRRRTRRGWIGDGTRVERGST